MAVTLQQRPLRVALVTKDASGGDLRDILEKRFAALGDEVVAGADVEAAALQFKQEGQDAAAAERLGRRLDCAILVAASLEDNHVRSWAGGAATYTIQLGALDLATGNILVRDTKIQGNILGMLTNAREKRRQTMEDIISDMLEKLGW